MKTSPQLFLSHAGVDSEAALSLARRLEEAPLAKERGLRVWIDKIDLGTGRRWKQGLQEALAASTAFAVYVGSRGIVNWVQDEVDVASFAAVVLSPFRKGKHGASLRDQQRRNAVAMISRVLGLEERLLFKDRFLFLFLLLVGAQGIITGQENQRHREAEHTSQ